jgi:hypothetical protein
MIIGDYPDWRRALQFRFRSKDCAIAQVVELKFSSPPGSRDPTNVGILEPRGLSRLASGSTIQASL